MDEIVTKSGEEWLRLSLVPDKRGLMIEVRAHPLVEEFAQSMGGNKKNDLSELGRNGWAIADAPISVYQMSAVPPNMVDNGSFRIDIPGYGMMHDGETINLSFLRIVGISNGVRFISTKDVFPLQFRRELKHKIAQAFRDFCHDYIKPVKITLVMTSQEI